VNLPSSGSVNAVLRHVGTASITAATVLGTIGILPSDKVQDVVNGLQHVASGLQEAFGGFSSLVVILGPVAVVWIAKAAAFAGSLRGQLTSVAANPEVRIEGRIVAPAAVANAVPSDKVVSH